jgi:hypothetical protein
MQPILASHFGPNALVGFFGVPLVLFWGLLGVIAFARRERFFSVFFGSVLGLLGVLALLTIGDEGAEVLSTFMIGTFSLFAGMALIFLKRRSEPIIINASVSEIQQEVASLIQHLERSIAQHPNRDWRSAMLALAREFRTLAAEQPLDALRIQDFTGRLRRHILSHSLKGLDDVIWFAEALERHAAVLPDRTAGGTG